MELFLGQSHNTNGGLFFPITTWARNAYIRLGAPGVYPATLPEPLASRGGNELVKEVRFVIADSGIVDEILAAEREAQSLLRDRTRFTWETCVTEAEGHSVVMAVMITSGDGAVAVRDESGAAIALPYPWPTPRVSALLRLLGVFKTGRVARLVMHVVVLRIADQAARPSESLEREREVVQEALDRGDTSIWSPEKNQWLLGPSRFGRQRLRDAENSMPLTDADGVVLPLGRAWLEMHPHVSLDHEAARRCYVSACLDEIEARPRHSRVNWPPRMNLQTVLARP